MNMTVHSSKQASCWPRLYVKFLESEILVSEHVVTFQIKSAFLGAEFLLLGFEWQECKFFFQPKRRRRPITRCSSAMTNLLRSFSASVSSSSTRPGEKWGHPWRISQRSGVILHIVIDLGTFTYFSCCTKLQEFWIKERRGQK